MKSRAWRAFAAVACATGAWVASFTVDPAVADPRMIAYGYTNCAGCHVDPQGAHLLNEYGEGIDDAQSFHATGQPAPTNWSLRQFDFGERVIQDLRVLVRAGTLDGEDSRGKVQYRNATRIAEDHTVTLNMAAEYLTRDEEQVTPYFQSGDRRGVFVDKALWHYRPRDGLELQIGWDQVPTPINVADRTLFVRARNRQGTLGTPTQIKLFLWDGKRQLQVYGFGPGFYERREHREWGAGLLYERDVGNGNAVLGIQAVAATSDALDRQLVGAYARWGFSNRIGLLLEHDLTRRRLRQGSDEMFLQFATFARVFWTPREWLVTDVTLEQLHVNDPFAEDRYKATLRGSVRWSRHWTTGVSASHEYRPGDRDTDVLGTLSWKL